MPSITMVAIVAPGTRKLPVVILQMSKHEAKERMISMKNPNYIGKVQHQYVIFLRMRST